MSEEHAETGRRAVGNGVTAGAVVGVYQSVWRTDMGRGGGYRSDGCRVADLPAQAGVEGDDPQIRSQHLLMALTEKPMLPACNDLWVLLSLSRVQLERLRPLLDAQSDECPARQPQVTETLTSAQPEAATTDAPAKTLTGKQDDALLAVLNRFTEDVTEKARSGRIDPVFGRDTEIRQMVDILSRRRKNNPILVGEPGGAPIKLSSML